VSELHESEQTCAAMDIEARAASYIQRRRYWDWSETDQTELNAWLAEALGHRVAFWRLEATLDRTERLAALRPSASGEAMVTPRGKARFVLLGIAMLGVLIVAGFAASLFLSLPIERTYTTPVGGHRSIVLADGSRIDLNTDTVLRARESARLNDVARQGRSIFPDQARCRASLCCDDRRSSRHRSRYEIPHPARCGAP
jgi:transmembrane sensor